MQNENINKPNEIPAFVGADLRICPFLGANDGNIKTNDGNIDKSNEIPAFVGADLRICPFLGANDGNTNTNDGNIIENNGNTIQEGEKHS